jgi:hypothetical protein
MEQLLRHPWVLHGLDVDRWDPSSSLPLVLIGYSRVALHALTVLLM